MKIYLYTNLPLLQRLGESLKTKAFEFSELFFWAVPSRNNLWGTMKKASDIQKMKKTSSMLDLVHKSKGTLLVPREILKNIEILAPEAVDTLKDLMLNSKADSVKLKAALEVLAIAGISKETKISIKTEVSDMDEKQINDRLNDLLGTANSVLLEGESEDVTPGTIQ